MRTTRKTLAAVCLIAGLAVPAATAQTAAGSDAHEKELTEMRHELRSLKSYVEKLERKLETAERQHGIQPEAAAADDPLAAAERQLGGAAPSAAPAVSSRADLDPLESTERQVTAGRAATGQRGTGQQYFNPLLSVVGDFRVNDPKLGEAASVSANRDKLLFPELELALQSNIDPFSRADVFVAVPNLIEGDEFLEGIELEEAFITYWRLPWDLQIRAGKFYLPFGKENPQHEHAFQYVDRSLAGQLFLGEEGARGTGVELQSYFNLSDDYSTQLHFNADVLSPTSEESLFTPLEGNEKLFLGRARLYHEFDFDNNIDIGYTHIRNDYEPVMELGQRLEGVDVTYRWEPTEQLGYEKLLLRAEHLWGDREIDPANLVLPGSTSYEASGTYAMADYTFQKYWAVGGRWDNSAAMRGIAEQLADGDLTDGLDGNAPGDRVSGYAAWLTWYASEFSRFRLQYNRVNSNFPRGDAGLFEEDMLTVQWTWNMGPHGAHKY